jgi:hypothetical protein
MVILSANTTHNTHTHADILRAALDHDICIIIVSYGMIILHQCALSYQQQRLVAPIYTYACIHPRMI